MNKFYKLYNWIFSIVYYRTFRSKKLNLPMEPASGWNFPLTGGLLLLKLILDTQPTQITDHHSLFP